VGDLLNALTAAGFGIERVVEAGSPVPDILAVRCRLQASPGYGRPLVTGGLGG